MSDEAHREASRIEQLCAEQGLRMTAPRRVIARVLSEASDHPDVDEVFRRVSAVDPRISLSTVYRTVSLLARKGIIARHDFGAGRMRFEEATSELQLSARVITTDYTPESGARATRQLLSDPEPPTAIAYDSDVLAVTGLGVAQQMGFSVPGDVSIVAWDDSLLCQVVHPPLTTVSRDISEYGALACKRLLAAIEDPSDTSAVEAPRGELTTRASTGPAPAPRLRPARVG